MKKTLEQLSTAELRWRRQMATDAELDEIRKEILSRAKETGLSVPDCSPNHAHSMAIFPTLLW